MLQLVSSMYRKPIAQSPSIGIIMLRTLPIALRGATYMSMLYATPAGSHAAIYSSIGGQHHL